MPLTKSDIPNLLLAGIRGIFFQAFGQYVDESIINKIATIVTSDKDQETYAWLGNVPGMREFKDERSIKGLIESSYSIKNTTWESTIGVDKAAIEDDQYGQIKIRIQDMAYQAALHKIELLMTLLASGFSTTCYDGQYFFDTDHVTAGAEYQTAQSNKGTAALSSSSLTAGITAMSKFKDDRGKVMNITADTLVVPADLEWTARELLESVYYPDKLASTDTQKLAINALQGRLDLVVSPYLTDTNNWYLLCTKRPVKPLILQDRITPEFSALEGNSETGFMRDKFLYGVRARYNAGYGLWQFAYGAEVS